MLVGEYDDWVVIEIDNQMDTDEDSYQLMFTHRREHTTYILFPTRVRWAPGPEYGTSTVRMNGFKAGDSDTRGANYYRQFVPHAIWDEVVPPYIARLKILKGLTPELAPEEMC